MSYSDTVNLIEEKGYEKSFESIYKDYKHAKKTFEQIEKEYNSAKLEMGIAMISAKYFVQRAASEKLTECKDGFHYVRRIVDNEVVWFKCSGEEYAIGYEQLTDFEVDEDQ